MIRYKIVVIYSKSGNFRAMIGQSYNSKYDTYICFFLITNFVIRKRSAGFYSKSGNSRAIIGQLYEIFCISYILFTVITNCDNWAKRRHVFFCRAIEKIYLHNICTFMFVITVIICSNNTFSGNFIFELNHCITFYL
jgi:hypothetical protein